VSLFGIDYAFAPHPAPAAIQAAGARFVMRYVSPLAENDSNGKNLRPAELAALRHAGLEVGIVAESGAGRMLAGHAAGAADAAHADSVVKALSLGGVPVYFACDFDATEHDQAAIDAYLDGAAGKIGRARTGIYGGYWPVSRARAAGKAAWFWGTIAWSGSNWTGKTWPHITQGLQASVGGVAVDVNHSHHADFGQWPRPVKPKPPAGPPYRHVLGAGASLAELARARGTTAEHLLSESAGAYTAADMAVLAKLHLPPGTPYYTSR
jgi:hypothetical protein